MKNSVVTLLLALLVVLTAVSVRRMVAGNATYAGTPTLVAIGTDPVPPVPPGKPSGPKEVGLMLLAIGTDPVPPVPPPAPKPAPQKPSN